MKIYQQLVIQEKAELDRKLQSLNEFAQSAVYQTLDLKDTELLREQGACMGRYSDVLARRIARFKQ